MCPNTCRFNTVGVSDAISMGTDGMSYSLQSRDLIADSIETVMGGQWYDANISLPGCDKNMPGTIIAMARLNRPALMIYGGTIKPGYSQLTNEPIDIVSAFQSYGEAKYEQGDCWCTSLDACFLFRSWPLASFLLKATLEGSASWKIRYCLCRCICK